MPPKRKANATASTDVAPPPAPETKVTRAKRVKIATPATLPSQANTAEMSESEAQPEPPTQLQQSELTASDAVIPTISAIHSNMKFVGPHASAAGGPFNAVSFTTKTAGQCFALFFASQRKWDRPPLTEDAIEKFKKACAANNFDKRHILPHGSYLINLGNPDQEKRSKSLAAFLEDVRLGISLYNFHPGSTVGECTPASSIALIADGMNQAIKTTPDVILVVENMAGQGNVLGGKFSELRQIIDLIKDKSRVGICLDTCHLFAAGYDIRTAEKFDAVMKNFDEVVGLKYLKAMHLNDSMNDLGSGKDRHDFIGKGKIGIEAFRFIMNDDRFNEIPMVLEVPVEPKTEIEMYQREIKLLYSLVGTVPKLNK
ncbi:DNA-(apurinic or apyrimidinic site) lyase [Physocladia obscura]|uniref:Apurinic-apyrimidinic endonuclease 1 n=1 Tax=Physocladia obscura TaxID=109957 RepID=A0AAD5XLY2_9FUNG|nr:DNA-(apurinic or apyrimidinic site) lyase [Physocladia obscura]